MALKYSMQARNTKMDALGVQIGASAKIRVYSGTRPASVAAAITGTLLVELTGNAAAFAGAAAAGSLTANAIANGTAVGATTPSTPASHFRIFKADGTTAVVDGDAGLTNTDMILQNTSIAIGQTVGLTSLVIADNNG